MHGAASSPSGTPRRPRARGGLNPSQPRLGKRRAVGWGPAVSGTARRRTRGSAAAARLGGVRLGMRRGWEGDTWRWQSVRAAGMLPGYEGGGRAGLREGEGKEAGGWAQLREREEKRIFSLFILGVLIYASIYKSKINSSRDFEICRECQHIIQTRIHMLQHECNQTC